ncbi:MAG: hypothetical protein AB1777_05420 [Bacteroidota bacterium]
MEHKVVFTDSIVVDFCKATADDNPIHNPNYMYGQKKGVVVPGMLLFSTIVNMLHNKTNELFNYYKLVFGNVICTYEQVDLGFEADGERRYLYAINGHDSFATKIERSHVLANVKPIEFSSSGINRAMQYQEIQLETYRRLTGSFSNTIADFLFTIAYASAALFKAIREPFTEVEKEINALLDKTINPDQVSPFYQTLEIFRVTPYRELKPEGTINYNIRFEREKINKTYVAYVVCSHNNQIFYNSIYKLVAIPDKLIMRMVKDRDKG